MKYIVYTLVAFLCLACHSDDDKEIVGTWKLAQTLADPGDGSGVFTDVTSNKTITFYNDETFKVSGNLCFFDPDGSEETEGYYSENDGKIYPTSCVSYAQVILSYRIENEELIVDFQCIEPCAERYVKIK